MTAGDSILMPRGLGSARSVNDSEISSKTSRPDKSMLTKQTNGLESVSRGGGPGEVPCFPCPHKSVCCKYGTALTREEGEVLFTEFGGNFVFYDSDPKVKWGAGKEFRTQTWNGRCAFHQAGGCLIHEHPHYPLMCRIFPFKDARNPALPRAYDAALCPEVADNSSGRPAIQRQLCSPVTHER